MERGRQGILLLDSQRGLALKQKSEELTGTIIRTRAGVGLKHWQGSCYDMILGRLFKKGTVQNRPDGSLVLVNEESVSYKVGNSGVAVWNQYTGVTFEQLCNDVAAKNWLASSPRCSFSSRKICQLVYLGEINRSQRLYTGPVYDVNAADQDGIENIQRAIISISECECAQLQ